MQLLYREHVIPSARNESEKRSLQVYSAARMAHGGPNLEPPPSDPANLFRFGCNCGRTFPNLHPEFRTFQRTSQFSWNVDRRSYCRQLHSDTHPHSAPMLTSGSGIECIYSCRHPLWGGSGSCENDLVLGTTCACDDDGRFSSKDSFGNPSCVLKSVLMTIFLAVAAYELSLTAVLAWNLRRHRSLPLSARHGKRATTWQRLATASM